MILLAATLALAAHPHPPALRAPSLSRREREKAAKPTKGEGDAIDQVARRYGLAGELLVAKGDRIVLYRAYGPIAPAGGPPHEVGERWRIASVAKQVTAAAILGRIAALAVREDQPAEALAAALDRPVAAVFGVPSLGRLSTRQLLTHHSGLPDPDATTPGADGVPGFYRMADDGARTRFCLAGTPAPGAPFRYNNCDYLVAATWLVEGDAKLPRGVSLATATDRGVPGFVRGAPEPIVDLSKWGAAGGYLGTARAVYDFDRSLMTGKLLPAFARDALWAPEGNGSYQALGQWVFPGKLAGCAAPKRIVQRDGEILGVQVRNFILPDDDTVVIAFTNRSSDDFSFGEVWQGKGFAHDLLSAAACA